MKNQVYTVKIKNWKKYNQKHNVKYKKFFLSNSFFTDSKIANLTQKEMLLFIYMLCVASEVSDNSVQIGVKLLPKSLQTGDKVLHNTLRRFEQIQLVSVEKNESLIIELNRNKLNRIEVVVNTKTQKEPKTEIQETPTAPEIQKPNASEKFDARFSPEARRINEFFADQPSLKDLKRYTSQIIHRWESFDMFLLFYDGILLAPGFKKIPEADKASRKRYFTSALMHEIGESRKGKDP